MQTTVKYTLVYKHKVSGEVSISTFHDDRDSCAAEFANDQGDLLNEYHCLGISTVVISEPKFLDVLENAA